MTMMEVSFLHLSSMIISTNLINLQKEMIQKKSFVLVILMPLEEEKIVMEPPRT